MRLLHTSDWHLGRSFGPVSLHEDQCAFVDWFVSTAIESAVDLVVIAGDVYDRAVPPTSSVDLVRTALVRLQAAGIRVVVITGNHDGAERVAAYDGLVDVAGVHIRGGYTRAGDVLRLSFADGALDVVAVPFLDPVLAPVEAFGAATGDTGPLLGAPEHASLPETAVTTGTSAPPPSTLFGDDDDPVQPALALAGTDAAAVPAVPAVEPTAKHRRPTHHAVMQRALAQACGRGIGQRSLVVAHAFVVGGNIGPLTSSSERELTVGGTGAIDAALFGGFSYTALGHLHAPQAVGHGPVRYSGAPLAYSFSETRPKQVVLVEIDATGHADIESIPVPVGRGVATLTGTIDDLVRRADPASVARFVRAVLTDGGAVIDAKARLQAVYPWVVEVELRPQRADLGDDVIPVHRRRRLLPAEAAAAFWQDVHDREPDADERELLVRGLDAAAAGTVGADARGTGTALMRPISLRLQAFGSFPDPELVRFDALAELGLFVVAGPTGSGKTTIFDAMAFALYGKVAGDRPPDVRSHHADGRIETTVELVFEVERRRYRVWRKPAQERPKQRGNGVRQISPEAELAEWTGTQWQGVLSGATKVTERCVEIVGLDLEQFQRVVLLPQGKFAEFLLSDTGKRQELLRQLFGSSLYLAATEWYQDEARRLQLDVGLVDQIISRHRTNALEDVRDIQHRLPPEADGTLFALTATPVADDAALDEIEVALLACLPQLADRQSEQAQLAGRAATASDVATVAKEIARRFERAAELRAQAEVLQEQAAAMELASARAADARRAQPVATAVQRRRLTAGSLDSADRGELVLRDEVLSGCASLDLTADCTTATSAAAALAVHADRLLGQLAQLDAVTAASAAARRSAVQLDLAVAEMLAADAQLGAASTAQLLSDDLVGRVRDDAARLDGAEAAAVAAATALAKRRRLAGLVPVLAGAQDRVRTTVDHEIHLATLFALGVAPRLAAGLHPGQPCAVCGSTEHPAPARADDEVELVELHQLENARDAVDRARSDAAEAATEIGVLRQDLGEVADREVAVLEGAHRGIAEAAAAARRASAELPGAIRQLEQHTTAVGVAVRELERTRIDLAGATARHDAALRSLVQTSAPVAGLSETLVRRAAADVARLQVVVVQWAEAAAAIVRTRAEHERADAQLTSALADSTFDDVAAAAAVAMDAREIAALEQRCSAWQQSVTDVGVRLGELVQQGLPSTIPDVAALSEVARTLTLDATATGKILAEVEQRCADARQSIERAREQTSGSATVRAEYEVARAVALTCAGQLGPRIMLETWVLAAELDRVTAAATVHLHRMSAGRYGLRRGESAGQGNRRTGLDLLVFDAHTGRERTPATLSGGERFQASLALALGLADVVSLGGTGSGRVFEALFVDEGFGSLDPDALDDAIGALQHLQSTGRMVGVITHVEAMKQQLRTGIEVRRRDDGRGARIVQAADLIGIRP